MLQVTGTVPVFINQTSTVKLGQWVWQKQIQLDPAVSVSLQAACQE